MERYGKCNWCAGFGKLLTRSDGYIECSLCGGTGFSGDSILWYEKERATPREKEMERITS